LDEVLADLAAVLGQEDHPLLAAPKEGKRLIVLITTDRPLSGPLNTNIVRFVARDIIDNPGDVAVITVGAKAAMRCAGPACRWRRISRPTASARASPTSCRAPGS